jgi:acyl carrier protein
MWGTPPEDIRDQPVLAAHAWDSVTMLEVLAQLESRLGGTLDLRAYQAARTVTDLVDLARSTLTSRSPVGR